MVLTTLYLIRTTFEKPQLLLISKKGLSSVGADKVVKSCQPSILQAQKTRGVSKVGQVRQGQGSFLITFER
jgi:hypothetical protein